MQPKPIIFSIQLCHRALRTSANIRPKVALGLLTFIPVPLFIPQPQRYQISLQALHESVLSTPYKTGLLSKTAPHSKNALIKIKNPFDHQNTSGAEQTACGIFYQKRIRGATRATHQFCHLPARTSVFWHPACFH